LIVLRIVLNKISFADAVGPDQHAGRESGGSGPRVRLGQRRGARKRASAPALGRPDHRAAPFAPGPHLPHHARQTRQGKRALNQNHLELTNRLSGQVDVPPNRGVRRRLQRRHTVRAARPKTHGGRR